MHGPSVLKDGKWCKTFFIAFIDDASRLITHGEFFYQDNTDNMIEAFRTALYKRGKHEMLYFDYGSNYTSKEILQACVRLNIRLSMQLSKNIGSITFSDTGAGQFSFTGR